MKLDSQLITYHTAPNGLRMVHLHVAGSPIGYAGVSVAVGSRDEDAAHAGLAHFVEHTIFKGTARRSSWHIINRMEAVGGELNAYTTKEETVVYSVFPGRNPARAAELISDLVCNSRFPERELAKEREVVADEIDSYLDTPSEAVFDDFEDLLFAGSGLGHNILGDRERLATFSSDVCCDYLRRYYVPQAMTVFYAGAMRAETVFACFERYFDMAAGAESAVHRTLPLVVAPFDERRTIDSHQCHTVIGARVGGLNSSERFAVALLTNILGGPGMNSLLNVALRERRGLVYNVEASTGIFSDCGELVVYYGCDPADESRCRRLVKETLASVADGYVNPRRLEQAKKQYLGQLTVGSVNLESRILGIARSTLACGRALSSKEVTDAIRAVDCDALRTVAARIAAEASSLTLG